MPVKTITAEINGKVRKITAEVPDGATDQDILEVVSGMKFDEPEVAPTQPEKPGFFDRAWQSTGGAVGDLAGKLYRQGGFKTLDEMGTAMKDRFQKNPNQIQGSVAARALDAAFGPVVDTVKQDFEEGNLAGAAGTIAGNLLMVGAPAIVRSMNKPLKSVSAAGREGMSTALRQSAEKQYGRVLNPTKQGTKFVSRDEVIPGLLDRNVVAGSLEGLQERALTQTEQLGQVIGNFWDSLPEETMIPIDDIVNTSRNQALEANTIFSNGKRIPIGPEAEKALGVTESLLKVIDEASATGADGVKVMPVKRLREVRQYFDDVAKRGKRYQGADLAEANKAEIHGKVADVIRGEFAKASPSLNAINKEYSFWKNVEMVADETLQRRTGQAKPLGRKIAEAAGIATGASQGGAIGALIGRYAMSKLEQLTTSAAWNTLNAVAKNKLANALSKGNHAEAVFQINKLKAEADAASDQSAQSAQQPARPKQPEIE